MLILTRKNGESVVVGDDNGVQHLLKVTVARYLRPEGATGLRSRFECACPSFGGVGTNPRCRPAEASDQRHGGADCVTLHSTLPTT